MKGHRVISAFLVIISVSADSFRQEGRYVAGKNRCMDIREDEIPAGNNL